MKIELPQQNINQSETKIGDKKLLVKLYVPQSVKPKICKAMFKAKAIC